MWTEELQDDPDRDFILQGLSNGFKILDDDKLAEIEPTEVDNSRSASARPIRSEVEKQIISELDQGHYFIPDSKPLMVYVHLLLCLNQMAR